MVVAILIPSAKITVAPSLLPGEPVKRFASVILNHPFIDGMFHICSMNKPTFEMGYPHGKHHMMIPYRLSQFWD
jgi:hypothetical protein